MSQESVSEVILLRNSEDRYMRLLDDMCDPEDRKNNHVGLEPNTISSLLDKIGSEGSSPIMATILFHAGIEKPTPEPYELYGVDAYVSSGDNDTDDTRMFAVYRPEGRKLEEEPDALIVTKASGRMPFKGYRDVWVNTWINHSKLTDMQSVSLDSLELEKNALKHIFTNDPHCQFDNVFVDQDTRVYRIGHNDPRSNLTNLVTVEGLGIAIEDYASPYRVASPRKRLSPHEDFAKFDGHPDILEGFAYMFNALELEVEEVDMEGGEHYYYDLTRSELNELKKNLILSDDRESITGVSLHIEDRPWDNRYEGRDEVYYSNNWGDMNIRLEITKGPITTSYALLVFMDIQGESAHLSKYTTENIEHSSFVSREAGHMLASMVDAQESETNLNHIDDFEYNSLLELVAAVARVRQ